MKIIILSECQSILMLCSRKNLHFRVRHSLNLNPGSAICLHYCLQLGLSFCGCERGIILELRIVERIGYMFLRVPLQSLTYVGHD